MKIKAIKTAIVLALVPLLVIATPAIAATQKNPAMVKLLQALTTASRANFTVTIAPAGQMPTTLKVVNSNLFELSDASSDETTVGKTVYEHLTLLQLLAAKKSATPSVRWFVTSQDGQGAASTVKELLAKLKVVARIGKISATPYGYNIAYNLSDPTSASYSDLLDLGDSFSGLYKVTLDSSMRISSVTTQDQFKNCQGVCTYSDAINFSYSKVSIDVPNGSTSLSVLQVDGLPQNTALEVASYHVADTSTQIAALHHTLVGADTITQAAGQEPTPAGLIATYTVTGLKFTMDGKSLCVDPSKDKKSGVVSVCN